MDVSEAGKEIRRAIDTGNVVFGIRESLHHLREGEGQLLVVAQNTPVLTSEDARHLAQLAEVAVYTFHGTGLDLGSICGKPHVVSTLLVLDAGKSRVQELGKQAMPPESTEEEISAPKKRGRKRKTT